MTKIDAITLADFLHCNCYGPLVTINDEVHF